MSASKRAVSSQRTWPCQGSAGRQIATPAEGIEPSQNTSKTQRRSTSPRQDADLSQSTTPSQSLTQSDSRMSIDVTQHYQEGGITGTSCNPVYLMDGIIYSSLAEIRKKGLQPFAAIRFKDYDVAEEFGRAWRQMNGDLHGHTTRIQLLEEGFSLYGSELIPTELSQDTSQSSKRLYVQGGKIFSSMAKLIKQGYDPLLAKPFEDYEEAEAAAQKMRLPFSSRTQRRTRLASGNLLTSGAMKQRKPRYAGFPQRSFHAER